MPITPEQGVRLLETINSRPDDPIDGRDTSGSEDTARGNTLRRLRDRPVEQLAAAVQVGLSALVSWILNDFDCDWTSDREMWRCGR
jgi:hypothetical protein